MHEELIKRFNSKVGPNDSTYFLGDFAFINRVESLQELLNQLNGKKTLIIGNHDKKPSRMMAAGFDAVFNTATLRIAQKSVMLCHYPYAPAWYKRWRIPKHALRYMNRRPPRTCEWLIHGHTHNPSKMSAKGKTIHVGVDAWDYYPVSIREIEALIQRHS